MASDHSGIVQQIEQVIAEMREEAAHPQLNGSWAQKSLTNHADNLSAVLVSLPAPGDYERLRDAVIPPEKRRWCEWTVDAVVALAQAHRSDSQDRDKQEAAALSLGLVDATPAENGPSVDDCLAEIRRITTENERLKRLVQTKRPELSALRDLEVGLRDYLQNGHATIERMQQAAKAMLGGNDDLPSLMEMYGICSDGKERVDAALAAPAASVPASPEPERQRLIATLTRLAATQRNLPVPLTEDERTDLRAATQVLASVPATQPEPRKCPHDCRPCQIKEQLQDSLARIQAHTASPSAEREKEP